MKGLVWLRRDLRWEDHPALYHASKACDEVILVFIATPKTWQKHHKSARQIQLIANHLNIMSTEAKQQGFGWLVLEADTFSKSVQLLVKLAQQLQVASVYAHYEYEVDEIQRDQQVTSMLEETNIEFRQYHDRLTLPPEQILTKSEEPFKVFTPFKRAWLTHCKVDDYLPLPVANPKQHCTTKMPEEFPVWQHKILRQDAWPVGGEAIQNRLQQFCESDLSQYHTLRDYPAATATSGLSPYLAQGMLSTRQCIQAVLAQASQDDLIALQQDKACFAWVNELLWREFYQYLLWHFPSLSKGKAFQPYTETIPWREDGTLFVAWCEGKTGFPLVDAAMRQLVQTGWMHNRLRMLVAMVLTKLMLIDWRKGEQFFMQHLIDGDYGANNGGWQWSASTGTDAAPYFRIFNPYSQSEKFDPEGKFIRQFCPELDELDAKSIHQPSPMECVMTGYPQPIVDYPAVRQQALEVYKAAKDAYHDA